jgi:FSR family fosmidomycin resistance protein-like MFS transporter
MQHPKTREDQHQPADEPAGFKTGVVLALSAIHFIHDVYSSFLAPLLPLLIEKLNLTLTQAGFLNTVMQLPSLLNPLFGFLAERYSARLLIVAAAMGTAVCMSLMGSAGGYSHLVILLVVAGCCVAMFHVPAPVMVARASGQRLGRGMSFFMTGGESARALGPLIAVGVVALFGLEHTWPIMLVGLAAGAWLYVQLRSVEYQVRGNAPAWSIAWRQMRSVLGPLAAILLARSFMNAGMTTFLPTFLADETGNLWLAGAGLTLFETAGVAGVLLAGSLSDRFGRRRILAVAFAAAPASMLLFAAFGGGIRIAGLLLTGFTLLASFPIMLAVVQENVHEAPAAANGLFMMMSFLFRSGVSVLVGWVADGVGLQTTYYISATVGMAAVPFLFLLPAATKRTTT